MAPFPPTTIQTSTTGHGSAAQTAFGPGPALTHALADRSRVAGGKRAARAQKKAVMIDDEAKRELIKSTGSKLAEHFRDHFLPGQSLAILGAALDQMAAWIGPDDIAIMLTHFRDLLDDIEKRQSTLH
jgi:hypothetical protein